MHQVSCGVFGTNVNAAKGAFDICELLIDLVARCLAFELNIHADFDAVVEGRGTLEVNFAIGLLVKAVAVLIHAVFVVGIAEPLFHVAANGD